MLGKMLKLGGIDNRPPKTEQTLARFRVARNVYPTPDGRVIPRYDATEYSVTADTASIAHMTQYEGSLLTLKEEEDSVTSQGPTYSLYRDLDKIPSSVFAVKTIVGGPDKSYSQAVTSYRVNNTVYFQCPYEGYLLKFDGVELRKSGVQQPAIEVTAGYSAAGTRHIKIIQHSLDFDGNEPLSESVYVPMSVGGPWTINTSLPSLNIIGQTNVVPSKVISSDGLEEGYFQGTATYNAGSDDFTLSSTGNLNDFQGKIGSYVFVAHSKKLTAVTGLSFPVFGVALKVKSRAPLRLDAKDAYVKNQSGDWLKEDINGALFAGQIAYGTKTFVTVWESVAANGIYYYRTTVPSFPKSIVPNSVSLTLTGSPTATAGWEDSMFTLAPILNDFYFVDSKKIDFNSQFNFGGEPLIANAYFGSTRPFYCMTVYQGVLLLANDNSIQYSDTSSGGSFEQTEGTAFIIPGDKEFGRITSICATQDFLFISRERKNYYLNGNILTGNYRIQEIIEAELGAWSNNASILVKDSVVFINSVGVFQVVGGGKAILLSETCPKNFENFDSSNVNEDVVFRMSGFSSTLLSLTNFFTILDDGLSVAYDEYRELLVFCKKGKSQTGNPAFVLHTRTGEFYEWNGILIGADISAIAFKEAKLHVGYSDFVNFNGGVFVENKLVAPRYMEEAPIKLYSSWMTAGEPSLEKNLLQLKLFGRVQTRQNEGLRVVAFKDWDYQTKITNTEYFPNDKSLVLNSQVQYSHKKRLNSDKVLAASVGIEINTFSIFMNDRISFELESMEIEFTPIQEGVKK